MICGSIYIKLIPSDKNLRFIKYCHIIKSLPLLFQNEVEYISSYINNKYSEQLIVPMGIDVHPGCIVKHEYVSIISKDIYDKYVDMMKKFTPYDCVRCVYTIGDVHNPYNSNNIHTSYGESLIKLGRYLDSSDELGIFKI